MPARALRPCAKIGVIVSIFSSKKQNAREGIKTLRVVKIVFHEHSRQKNKMPARALRRSRWGPRRWWIRGRSKKQNAREGIKTDKISKHFIGLLFCQKNKMPARALRPERWHRHPAAVGLCQKNKMPARALRRSTTLLPVEGAGGVKKTKCPRGH